MNKMNLDFGDPLFIGDTPSDGTPVVQNIDSKEESLSNDSSLLDMESAENTLEIYKKAERFNRLKLLSGNALADGKDVEKYIEEHYGPDGVKRMKLAKFIMNNLGYSPAPDVLLMLSCTNNARIVIATAGAGKTTSLQFDLIISKLLDKASGKNDLKPELIEGTTVTVPRILYLNYNKHNVYPIEQRHVALCSAVNKLLKEADGVDNSIESSTVHAFCHKWLKAFSADLDIPELSIISDDDKKKVWEAIMTPRWKKFYGDSDSCYIEYTLLDELYNYKTESMLDWDDFFMTAKFVDSGLKSEFVKACIKKYDSMKRQMKMMDFTDYLLMMIETLKTHPELKERLQHRYKIIVADENQDFTRLMNELLIQLYNPEHNKLVVVGDPDQTIYAFKGVSPDNVVALSEQLEDVQLLGLDINYRCPDKIVEAAKAILDRNVLRFKKPIETVRTGGQIVTHPLAGSSQESDVIALLNRIGRDEWKNTVITYRNNMSSIIMGEELYYAGIPFKILDDRRPFNNPVFRQITNALKALKKKDDYELNKSLYRFLPMSKEYWQNILECNRDNRRLHLHDLSVPQDMPRGSLEALKVLIEISEIIDTQPTCDYIASLVKLYKLYYFNFIVQQAGPIMQGIDSFPLFLDRTLKFYQRQSLFDYLMAELSERNVDNELGVTLSTFHGLKGLEFDYVIAIDFNESLFPNYFGIEQRYPANTALEEKESENRLCYVLVTRTIKEFHMFFNRTDPSCYISILTHLNDDTFTEKHDEDDELTLGTVQGFNSLDSRMSFVQRLLGDRR